MTSTAEIPMTAAASAAAQWPFVIAAYAVGVGAVALLIAWSWWAMRRAEKRRDAVLGRRDAR